MCILSYIVVYNKGVFMLFELFVANPFVWVVYFFTPFMIMAWLDTKKKLDLYRFLFVYCSVYKKRFLTENYR